MNIKQWENSFKGYHKDAPNYLAIERAKLHLPQCKVCKQYVTSIELHVQVTGHGN